MRIDSLLWSSDLCVLCVQVEKEKGVLETERREMERRLEEAKNEQQQLKLNAETSQVSRSCVFLFVSLHFSGEREREKKRAECALSVCLFVCLCLLRRLSLGVL